MSKVVIPTCYYCGHTQGEHSRAYITRKLTCDLCGCREFKDHWANHPETLDYANTQSELHRLIDALEAGGYAAASGNLTEGSPLVVESLEATMRVVTFSEAELMPFRLRRYATMCARAAKWCKFFRIRSWEDLFKRAEAGFIADYHHARAVLDSNRDYRRHATGEGSSSSQP